LRERINENNKNIIIDIAVAMAGKRWQKKKRK